PARSLSGSVAEDTKATRWAFDLAGNMRMKSDATTVAPLSEVAFKGVYMPSSAELRVDRMNIAWPEVQIAGRGSLSPTKGITVSGQIGETSKSGLLSAWPPEVASDARDYIASSVETPLITGGQFSLSLPSDVRVRMEKGGDIPAEALAFDLAANDLEVTYLRALPNLQFPKATLSIRGRTLRVKSSAGFTQLAKHGKIALEQSDLVVRDLRQDKPETQIFTKIAGDVPDVLAYLEKAPFADLKLGPVTKRTKGRAEGVLRLRFPMHPKLAESEVRMNGKFTVKNAEAKNVFPRLDVAGGALTFDVTEKAVEASGDVLVNGVPGKVRWLRLLDGAEDKQPPLRVSARLDASDRKQLGINVNHFVEGTIAADIAITARKNKPPLISVQTDLTQADVSIDYLSWRKAAGRSAIAQFDVVPGNGGRTTLQNFKVVGENIAVDGWIELGKDRRVQRFSLPEFTINVITQMSVAGELRADKVWDVKVRAANFDARPIFKNLFSPKRFSQHVPPKETRRAGLIIRAFIKSMIGYSNTNLQDAQIVLERRDGKIRTLEANGVLPGGTPLTVSLSPNARGIRILRGQTKDAGGAFRLIGFYKNVRKGEAKLRIVLDRPGLEEVAGTLWTRNFFMLGDTVVNEVLESGGRRNEGRAVTGIETQRDQQGRRRTVIKFSQLRFNFSVGNGQFLLKPSYVNGPALGATLQGKVDFQRRIVNLGGTYIPLYGLNAAIGALPILGDILVGREGEGIFGVTFGVQGRLDKPDVLVNPVSLVAPGIFRQIFTLSPEGQQITPRSGAPASQSRTAPRPPSNSSWTTNQDR
ncbi:MAG: AsmA-like C-terminal region-containing protein, partial [Pseudomonadota bacterium]